MVKKRIMVSAAEWTCPPSNTIKKSFEGGLEDQWKRRTVVQTEGSFPALENRLVGQTMSMMYRIVAQALEKAGLSKQYHPQDYLSFFCLSKRERTSPNSLSLASQKIEDRALIWQRILPDQIQPDSQNSLFKHLQKTRRTKKFGNKMKLSLPKAHTSRLLIINSCNLVVLHSKSTFWTIVHSSSHSFSPLRL